MSRSLVLVFGLAFAGCSVGEVPIGGGGGPDGGSNGGGDGGQTACVNRVSPPNTAHQHGAGIGGGTKAGQGCVVAGCHLAGNTGAGAPPFTMAGTLYKPDGSTPSAGAEIRLASDAGGTPLVAKTDDAGNFYTGGTVAFPAHTLASGCPTQDAHMSGSIANAGNGNCNGGTACHQVPGGLPMTLADQ